MGFILPLKVTLAVSQAVGSQELFRAPCNIHFRITAIWLADSGALGGRGIRLEGSVSTILS
jgi:hypothetical protein